MKIPRTYKGIQVEVQKKTPKVKSRSIATSDVKRNGEPVIRIWPKNKRHVTPYVLKHEVAHIELGHHKPPYANTVKEYWKREIKADRKVYKGKDVPSALLGNSLDNMTREFKKRDKEWMKKNPDEAQKILLKNSTQYGFSKDEMSRAIKYIKTHRRKNIKTD